MPRYTTWAEIFAAFVRGELQFGTHRIMLDDDTVFLATGTASLHGAGTELEELFMWDEHRGQNIVVLLQAAGLPAEWM